MTDKTNAQHTPGPWMVRHDDDEPAVYAGDTDNHDTVAVCCCLLEGEAQANARLIAAAPAMLDALAEVAAQGDPMAQGPAGFAAIHMGTISKARAAIRKARGGA